MIGREDELLSRTLEGHELNLIRPERFDKGETRVRAMVRYRATPAAATAEVRNGRLHLQFDEPTRAVTPGQLVALFDDQSEEVLGAATIERTA